MEFKIKRDLLEKNLNSIVRLIPPKSTYTVLQNIIIAAKDKALSIEGTDLDVFVKKIIPADVKTEGKVLLPGKKILEIAREANADDMAFKLKELNLQIVTGGAHYNIPALDSQEFPEVPKFPEKIWLQMTVGDLGQMVDSTIFMVSKDISRRPMNGILIQSKDNEMRVVTTDGARLAMCKKEMRAPVGELIAGPKIFDLLDLDRTEEKIDLFMEERMMGVKYLNTTIIARLIEGPYPNYEGVIPKTFAAKCTIEKGILEGALKRMAVVASSNIKNVKFDFAENTILLYASSPDSGEGREQVPCQFEGEKTGIWFNANYVLEIFRHITANDVVFQLTSASTAAVVRPKDDENMLYLLMPLRIDSYE
ncbi:MAG TPA: DNA polymerase III subunit beta [bacterium]